MAAPAIRHRERGSLPGQGVAFLLKPTRSTAVAVVKVRKVGAGEAHGVLATKITAPMMAKRAVPTAIAIGSRDA